MMPHRRPPHFTTLDERQLSLLIQYEREAMVWNGRLNLFSESSAEDFWVRHVLHSLTIAIHEFPAGARVVDWGTGGGLPGIPLAIAFPRVRFYLVDAVEKKARAVRSIARRLGLANVEVFHGRAEAWRGEAHYAVSRATAPLETLWGWTERVLKPYEGRENAWQSGLLTLKGGDLSAEENELRRRNPEVVVHSIELSRLLGESFEDKRLLHVRKKLS